MASLLARIDRLTTQIAVRVDRIDELLMQVKALAAFWRRRAHDGRVFPGSVGLLHHDGSGRFGFLNHKHGLDRIEDIFDVTAPNGFDEVNALLQGRNCPCQSVQENGVSTKFAPSR